MVSKANFDIKVEIKKNHLLFSEVAEKLGVKNVTFSKWLSKELPEFKRQEILKAVEELREEIFQNEKTTS